MSREVVVTGVGVVCALGDDPHAVNAALDTGACGLAPCDDLRDILPLTGFGLASVDIRPLLKRRKDRKLMPRAAELALWASFHALGTERAADIGLMLGVGREPPDKGETADAIEASMVNGRFDADALLGPGRAAYPPLASLRTLPNLQLAHVAIQLDLVGPGATRAGGAAAGLAAIVEGWLAVAEGRADVVLAGGADCMVDPGNARDHIRLGVLGPADGPGEGAAVLRLEAAARAEARGATVLGRIDAGTATGGGRPWVSPLRPAIGYCGAASAPLLVALEIARGRPGRLSVGEASGAAASLSWRA